MKIVRIAQVVTALAWASLWSGATLGQSAADTPWPDGWSWRLAIYGWFPDVRANTNVQLPAGGTLSVDTHPGSYLRNLEFAFMATLDARKGPWSFIADGVYVDFGRNASVTSVSGPGGVTVSVSANAHVDLKGFVGTLAGGYTVIRSPANSVDVVGGARYLHVKTTVDWEFDGPIPLLPPQGTVAARKDFWDGIVGARGQAEIAERWYVPYYVDAGTGSSRFTWQAFAGLGYHFDWGDAMIGYRHLAYDFRSDRPVSDLTFSGPLAGLRFRF